MGLPDERFKCFDREAFDVINDAADSKTEPVAFYFSRRLSMLQPRTLEMR